MIRNILFKLHALLKHDEQELNRRVAQLEILGELRNVQQIIFEEEQIMAITYNIENDIRYNQGLQKGIEKGIEKGLEKANEERNTAFVTYLVQNTDHDDERISRELNVPLQFVINIRKSIFG